MENVRNLKKLVIEEAVKLRQFTTERERSLLSFDNINPNSPSKCIYGQMTGYCFGRRACQLFEQCAVNFSGAVERMTKKKRMTRMFSAIEFYICRKGAKLAVLIAFLKGDISTLKTSML